MDFINRNKTAQHLNVTVLTIIRYENKGLLKPVLSKNIVTYDLIEVMSLAMLKIRKIEVELSDANQGYEELIKLI